MLEQKNVGTWAGGKERNAGGRKSRRKLRWALVGWKLTCYSPFGRHIGSPLYAYI
jgi:hypothetical protein